MQTAIEIWNGIGTYDKINLIEKYGRKPYPYVLPYEIRRPSKEQIISVLTAAKIDGYLLTPFIELLINENDTRAKTSID